jgi:creatinine amidohydrolase
MHLAELSWSDAEAAGTDLALLPVGSTEQHGPHAPIGTDAYAAEAVAAAGADAAERPVVVAPTIPVGVAEEHRAFAGTLWVSPDAFRQYVRETIESLTDHGWDQVVVVNGHGGNVPALREVCGRLSRDGTASAVPFTWFEAVDPEAAGLEGASMGHGGPVETSLLRHLRPELVETDRFAAAAEAGAAGWGDWVSGANLAYDSDEFTDNGVVGDPGRSDPEAGAALLEQAANALAELVAAVRERAGSGASGPE